MIFARADFVNVHWRRANLQGFVTRRAVFIFSVHITFCHCRVESKRSGIRRLKYWQISLAILAALSGSIALADDLKTIDGKEYKHVTVNRVEPDGIIITHRSGVAKIPFTELPEDVQERFGYDASKVEAEKAAARAAEAKQIEERRAARSAGHLATAGYGIHSPTANHPFLLSSNHRMAGSPRKESCREIPVR